MANIHDSGFEMEANGEARDHSKLNGNVAADQPNGLPSDGKTFEIPLAKLAEVNLTDYMRESLDKVAFSEGFKSYELNVDHGSAVGDGFIGLLYKVTINEIDSDKKLAVVVKFPPTNKAMRDDFGAMELFKREVFVYNELLPEFVKFQKEKKIKDVDGFFNFPKCYFAEHDEEKDESVLIMEDLRESGHQMWDKYQPVNLEHTKLIMASLGRLHALSFALKVQKPELFEKFKGMNDFMSQKFGDEQGVKMMSQGLVRAADSIDAADVKRKNRVLNLADNYGQVMKEVVDPKLAEPYAVVTHGDCWSNNFMFYYKGGSPRRIVLLDWQISRYCSPALDLVYFIFSCTSGDLRAKHFDELLNIYHRSLKELLDHLGGDTISQFPFTALIRQLKQFGKFGILMASNIIPMLSLKKEEIPDMAFVAENMKNEDPEKVAQIMATFGQMEEKIKPKMRAALLDAMRLGYI